tara:strand:- start:5120 stop:6502 length:1383 start_codon:yes stop_codon:yes gene_type:complete
VQSVAKYKAVKKYGILRGYLEHFRQVSINNDTPALLSFFFAQGQAAVPYIRIPYSNTHLDPRVHVFWIQSSRTGKSIAWEFVGSLLKEAGLRTDSFTTGSDAGLIGGFEQDEEGNNTPTEGLLAGRKALNFDEGSIILTNKQHFSEVVLYLQQACAAVGSNSNILVKHLKPGTIEAESLVSLWITTYPPSGVKEYVLTRGIFQRVLLFWRHWSMDMRSEVENIRLDGFFNKPKEDDVSFDDLVQYFKDLDRNMAKRVCELAEITPAEWETKERPEQEEVAQSIMHQMFSVEEEVNVALRNASEDYFTLVENMDPSTSEIVASFIPGLNNYTVIFATHLALLEGKWHIRADHIEMSKEILFDLYQNLIIWLEGEVQVGQDAREKAISMSVWKEAYEACSMVGFDDIRGDGWVRKKHLLDTYCKKKGNCSLGTARNHYGKVVGMFKETTSGRIAFVRLEKSE